MADLKEPGAAPPGWTIIKILRWTHSYFTKHAIDSPRLTAEILLAHCLGMERLDLYLQHDRPLEQQELSRYKSLIKRRIQHEPVAYITGRKGFYESEFAVSPDVLIPRPDTELIVEQALAVVGNGDGKRVLELGTGSGAIIVSLAKAVPGNVYFATDISPAAVKLAKENAAGLQPGIVSFCAGSWFSMVSGSRRFDLIVSNPPYIPGPQIDSLQPEVCRFEPRPALDGGPDGLDSYRMIIGRAAGFLSAKGCLLLEIGCDQKQGIRNLLNEFALYQPPEFIKDLAGHDRVVMLKKQID